MKSKAGRAEFLSDGIPRPGDEDEHPRWSRFDHLQRGLSESTVENCLIDWQRAAISEKVSVGVRGRVKALPRTRRHRPSYNRFVHTHTHTRRIWISIYERPCLLSVSSVLSFFSLVCSQPGILVLLPPNNHHPRVVESKSTNPPLLENWQVKAAAFYFYFLLFRFRSSSSSFSTPNSFDDWFS